MPEHDVILDFDPLRVTLPGPGPFVGRVRLVFPEVHVKFWDLSMGIDLLQGAHIGADGRVFSLDVNFPEPGMEADKLLAFVYEVEEQLVEMYRLVQAEMDKRFLMEGGKRDA